MTKEVNFEFLLYTNILFEIIMQKHIGLCEYIYRTERRERRITSNKLIII